MPQKRPALTTQVSGAVEMGAEAVVVVVVVIIDVVVVVVVVVPGAGVGVVGEVVLIEAGGIAPPAGVRYQFATGSWRHSPAVTPVQPLALMRSK